MNGMGETMRSVKVRQRKVDFETAKSVGQLCLIFVVLLLPSLWVAGTPFFQAVLLAIGISIQAIPGVLLFRAFSGRLRVSFFEVLGASAVLGSIVFLALDQLFRGLGWSVFLWWLIPLASLASLVLIPRLTMEIELPSKRQFGGFVGVITLGVFLLSSLWVSNPLEFDSWVAYFADLSYHEALASGLAFAGPSQTPFLAGLPFDYHWFGDAWAGGLTRNLALDPYVALSRGLYVYSVVTSAALAWAWATKVSKARFAGFFAALMLIGATFIGMGFTYSYSMFLVDISPTHTFAIPITLLISMIAIEYVSKSHKHGVLILLVILGGALMASRAPQAAIVLAAVLGSMLIAVRFRSRFLRLGLVALALAIGMAVSFVLVIAAEGSRQSASEIVFSPNNAIVSIFALIPYTGLADNLVAYLGLVFSVGAGWAGLLYAQRSSAKPVRIIAIAWAASAGIAALLAVTLVSQGGRSQISFLWAGAIIVLPMSGVGIAEAWSSVRRSDWKFPAGLIVVGSGLGILAVVNFENTRQFWFAGYLRWGAPLGVWFLAFLLGFIYWKKRAPTFRRTVFGVAAIVLGSAAVVGNVYGSVERTLALDIATAADTPLAINRDHFYAATWVRDHVNLEAGYIATNRQCDEVAIEPTGCVSTSYITSALTGRPTLIEGFSYGIQSMPDWAQKRSVSSFGFAKNATEELASYFWTEGVRWVWIDRMVETGEQWRSFGEVVFESPTVSILRLEAPS